MKVIFLKQRELGLQEEHHPEEAGEAGVQQGSQDKQHQWWEEAVMWQQG